MTSQFLLPVAYAAPISYYAYLVNYQCIIETRANYVRQTYANRCQIAASDGLMALSIPVVKPHGKQPLFNVRIDYKTDWQTLHWRALESAYSSTPFFDFYRDDLCFLYKNKSDLLLDFNTALQNKILELLQFEDLNILYSDKYINNVENHQIDLREMIHPKKKCIHLHNILKVPYWQVFEQKLGFLPDLSIFDLLFNLGNEARLYLLKQKDYLTI